METFTQTELAAIRQRHVEACRSAAKRSTAEAAHRDRERLLAMVDDLLPVVEAARMVTTLVQRGPLPTAARRALLDLHLALTDAAKADLEATLGEVGVDEAGYLEPQRLSA